jgi:mannonate dehydratase
LRFDNASFVAFDVFILQRPGAQNSYTAGELARARTAFDLMSDDDVSRLSKTIVAGLPGSTTESFDLNAFRDRLQTYSGLSADDVKANLLGFVSKVAPIAEDLGVRLALHPDDPPRPLFGLPRVVSTGDDYTRSSPRLPPPPTECASAPGASEFFRAMTWSRSSAVSGQESSSRTFVRRDGSRTA